MIKRTYIFIILMYVVTSQCIGLLLPIDVFASGNIRKLKGIADSMASMQLISKEEEINYIKADSFFSSDAIQTGLKSSDLIVLCGEPVAIADQGRRWVYKPPTSTFFKGEKIYFFFDADQNLISWEKVYQK